MKKFKLNNQDSLSVQNIDNEELKEAVEVYDNLLNQNKKDKKNIGIKKLSNYHQPLIRLKRAGKAKKYKVTAIIDKSLAEKKRKKEFRHSNYLKYILICVLLIILLLIFYTLDPIPKLNEIIKSLGY